MNTATYAVKRSRERRRARQAARVERRRAELIAAGIAPETARKLAF